MRISDWSSDVCSSDLRGVEALRCGFQEAFPPAAADPEHAGVSFPIPHSRFRPSGLRPLPLVVFPLQDPPGDEAVHRLAGGEPGFAQPGGALEDAALDRGDRLRAVGALVLEQVAQVLARQQAHPSRARLRSEEHTSELQSLMRTSYAVFRLK